MMDGTCEFECVLCGKTVKQWGNNPWPLKEAGSCCDQCNWEKVIPARMWMTKGRTHAHKPLPQTVTEVMT